MTSIVEFLATTPLPLVKPLLNSLFLSVNVE
jgi:hypothetical protein